MQARSYNSNKPSIRSRRCRRIWMVAVDGPCSSVLPFTFLWKWILVIFCWGFGGNDTGLHGNIKGFVIVYNSVASGILSCEFFFFCLCLSSFPDTSYFGGDCSSLKNVTWHCALLFLFSNSCLPTVSRLKRVIFNLFVGERTHARFLHLARLCSAL